MTFLGVCPGNDSYPVSGFFGLLILQTIEFWPQPIFINKNAEDVFIFIYFSFSNQGFLWYNSFSSLTINIAQNY